MAGLVGGDSDSSALTQESGDEAVFTPRDSVITGTDPGTDYEDDADPQEISPGLWLVFSSRIIVTSSQHRVNRKPFVVVDLNSRGGEV